MKNFDHFYHFSHKKDQVILPFLNINYGVSIFVAILAFIITPVMVNAQSQTFTSTGTFTVPQNINSITVECWGGGGAGGGATGNPAAGGGGAGGNYVKSVLSVSPGASYTVTVGGTKTATATSTAATNKGNPSWFGSVSLVYATGGNGGAPATSNSTNGAGGTSSSTGCIGDLIYAGGSASNGNYTSGTAGGAGGGGAGTTGPGGNASAGTRGAGTTLYGGNGANGVSNSTAGAAGSTYGGGGSGGKANTNTDRAGGSGAAGMVLVSWTCSNISTFPFTESFDGTTFPPSCWSVINAGSGNNWTRSTSTPYAGAGTMFYGYSTSSAANTWAFTPGMELQAGHKYTLSFYQKVASATYPEKLKVTVGTSATVASQTTTLWNNAGGSGLTNTTYALRTADFICSTAGTYYFAFNCYSDVDMYNLFVDEVTLSDAGLSCDFTASRSGGYTQQNIIFSDNNGGVATSWDWNFGADAVPPTANTLGPHTVYYTTPGLKTVTLTINGTITTTKTAFVSIAVPLPPRQLAVAASGLSDASLTWLSPAINDGFEPYDDFDLNFGNFTFVDVEGGATYGIVDVTFPNAGYTGSFIEFNPALTTPALPASWAAHSGNKYAVCFSALTASAPNNDWMITPKMKIASGEQFKFWAKSITDSYGLERFKVGVSTTGTQPADFTIISTGTYLEAPITWTEFTFNLSAYIGQEVYIGINCVSNDAFAFMVDDVSISGGPSDFSSTPQPELISDKPEKSVPSGPSIKATQDSDNSDSFSSYKIYRNGSEIATVNGFSYTDADLVPGTWDYTISAIYADPLAESVVDGPEQLVTTLTRWTGNNSTDWNTGGNWRTGSVPGATANIVVPFAGITNFPEVTQPGTECTDLTIKNGASLSINSTASLTVSGTLSNETGINGFLIKSDTYGTGSLINGTSNVEATIQRYIPNDFKWHFLASPVIEQNIWPEFAPVPSGTPLTFGAPSWNWDLYTWNPNANILIDLFWTNLRKNDQGDYNDLTVDFAGSESGFGNSTPPVFTSGRGYLAAYNTDWNPATGSPSVHSFKGAIHTGIIERSVSAAVNTYNLIGNPYPSAIDWKSSNWGTGRDVLETNGGGYDYWIWNDAAGNYGVFNSLGADNSGTNGSSRYIAAQQGYFVKASSNGLLALNNGVRTHSSQSWLKNSDAGTSAFRLKISSSVNSFSDEMAVEFNATEAGGSDKFWSMYSESPELYSVKDGYQYSIDRYEEATEGMIIPLGTKIGVPGSYKLEVSDLTGFSIAGKIILDDMLSGVKTDLKSGSGYSFYADPSDTRTRFRLILGAVTGVRETEKQDFTVYSVRNTIIIENNENFTDYLITVRDLTGKTVYRTNSGQKDRVTIEISGASGIYFVSIDAPEKSHNQKVLIRQ